MPKKPTIYNRISKEFTKLNNKLPEDRKLSVKQRREIIKTKILPKYKNVPYYKFRVKPLQKSLEKIVDKIPPKDICDLNYIDASDFAYVEWFSLDETIRELVPDCVFVKVSAGMYGETKIFNTRNYDYTSKGVKDIVEAIRPDANNNSGRFLFSGYKKLRPRKRNDGTPENYYLDFILIFIDKRGNEEAFGETESVEFEVPKNRENRKKKTKIKHVIEDKIKALKSKKDATRRAKKTLQANIKKLTQIANKAKKSPTLNNGVLKTKQFTKTAELLEKYKATGKLTPAQYEKNLDEVLRQLNK